MLGKVRDAIRIQTILASKGLKVTPLEAYDSWVRYSLVNGESWIEIRKKDKDETIYRKVRHHIATLDENTELLKVKDRVEEKFYEVTRDFERRSKNEFQKLSGYKSMILYFQRLSKSVNSVKS